MIVYIFSPGITSQMQVAYAQATDEIKTERGPTVKRKYLWFLTPLLLLGLVVGEASLSRSESTALVVASQGKQPAPLQLPTIKLPAEVKGEPGQFIRVAAETNGTEVRWLNLDTGLNLFPVDLLRDTKTAVVTAKAAGRYRLAAWTAKGDVPSEAAVCVVIIGSPGPIPPGPDPTPPGPQPVPVSGLKALIVYETGDASKLPPAQQAVLYSKTVRDFLNSKTAIGPDGKTREWRIYDKDVDMSGETKVWQDLMKRPRASVPWIVLTDGAGTVIHEGLLPANVQEMLDLLGKFAPAQMRRAG